MITVYQVNLKENDLIQAIIKSVDRNKVDVDTSGWANIDTAYLDKASESLSIAPGNTVYSDVVSIESGVAKLHHKTGVYQRNHLPGDTLRVQTIDNASTNLCKAVLENPRNLDSLYVVGCSVFADVSVEIALIRGKTGVALPKTIHHQGLVSGETVEVTTTAGSSSATVSGIPTVDDKVDISDKTITVELSNPAPTSGPATIQISDSEGGMLTGKIKTIPANLPPLNTNIETGVNQTQRITTYETDDTDIAVKIELNHPSPISGHASINITGREEGIFQGELTEFVNPKIKPRRTYNAVVVSSKNEARIKKSGNSISVTLSNNVSTTGEADVRVTKISDEIVGKAVGDVRPIDIDSAETSGVDMTNLSKL